MRARIVICFWILNGVLTLASAPVIAAEQVSSVRLVYQELEQGVDPYKVTYTVASEFLRIDDESDDSGFIVFDVEANKIFSVSHLDKSILVIPEYNSADFKPDFKTDIEYKAINDAPKIAGKAVYNYRVTAMTGEICMDIQLVPGLLPKVADTLKSFQTLISGQHITNLDKTPEEYRTPCYLVDLVYNKGDYYSKGLPVIEKHSNGKIRQLVNFEDTAVDASIFTIPAEYRQYSLQ
jgi:hypothetical protein